MVTVRRNSSSAHHYGVWVNIVVVYSGANMLIIKICLAVSRIVKLHPPVIPILVTCEENWSFPLVLFKTIHEEF